METKPDVSESKDYNQGQNLPDESVASSNSTHNLSDGKLLKTESKSNNESLESDHHGALESGHNEALASGSHEALESDHKDALESGHDEALASDHNEALMSDHNETLESDHNEGLGLECMNQGHTFTKHQYDNSVEAYQELSKNLQTHAMTTMINLLELQKSSGVGVSQKTEPPLPMTNLNALLKQVEADTKKSARHIAESTREQTHTLTQINELELGIFRKQQRDLIKKMLSKIPTQQDLEDIENMRMLIKERNRLNEKLQKMKMQIKAINKAMANVDVIVSESAAIKRNRKVVIQTITPENACPSCQRVYTEPESKQQTNESDRPPLEELNSDTTVLPADE